jgi:hypothetical protein
MRQLLLWTFFLLSFLSFAQRGPFPVRAPVVNHYVTIHSFPDEQSALSFDKRQSSFYKELTFLFEKRAPVLKGKPTLLTATLTLPPDWQGKEKFIHLSPQKIPFELLLNGVKLSSVEKHKPLTLQITALLKEAENKVELVIDARHIYQEGWLKEIAIMATPALHVELFNFSQAYSHLPGKVTNWNADFNIRNYGQSPYDGTNGYTLKVYNDSMHQVKQYVYLPDTVDKIPSKPVEHNQSYWEGVVFFGTDYYRKWTAETPYLYRFTLEGRDLGGNSLEVVSGKAGFRAIRTDGEKLYLGNIPESAPITFKAVRYRLPTDIDSLYSKDILKEQLRELKAHHVNTIILQEYAAGSFLYELCDELEIYIVQQFDFPMPADLSVEQRAGRREANWQRILTLANILRNHPSVIAYQIEKDYNRMEDLVNVSLGVSGPVSFYQRTTFDYRTGSYDKRLPVLKEPLPDWQSLSSRGRKALAKHYQPLHLSVHHQLDNTIYLENVYDFSQVDNLRFQWEIKEQGQILQQGEIESVQVLPKKQLAIALPFSFADFKAKVGCHFKFSLVFKEAEAWAAKDHVLLEEEFAFKSIGHKKVLVNTADGD